MFKVGDKVRCIDTENANEELILNKIYTVINCYTNERGSFVILQENVSVWVTRRFHKLNREEKLRRILGCLE